MATNDTMKYDVIKQISITDAMAASSKSATQERTLAKANGSVWAQTVCVALDSINMEKVVLDTSKDGIKVITDILKANMQTCIFANRTIPEQGKNRQGKSIDLTNDKTNTVKWMSWDETFRIFDYLGSVAKCIAHGLKDELRPETLKVASRCDILKKCKSNIEPLEHVKRLVGDCQKYLDELENGDATEGQAQVDTLTVKKGNNIHAALGAVRKMDQLVGGMSEQDKTALKEGLMSFITKNFA